MRTSLTIASLVVTGLLASAAHAADASFTIEVKNGSFVPSRVEVPANQKIQLIVKNQDSMEAEFESYPLDQEEEIAPGEQTELSVGPLDPGEYEFFDDYNPDAKGVLIAK